MDNPFHPKLSQPALRALSNHGVKSLKDLTRLTKREVSQLHGMGPKGIRQLEESLAAKGLSFLLKP